MKIKSSLTDKEREIAKISAKFAAEEATRISLETIERDRKRQKKDAADRRLHNTKLLLKNYRGLKAHSLNAIFDSEGADEPVREILSQIWEYSEDALDMFFIDSVRRSATRTALMINHIDAMVGIYEGLCAKSSYLEDKRRFRVLQAMYLNDVTLSAREIAEAESIDTRTVYKDIDAVCSGLSVLLFGLPMAE